MVLNTGAKKWSAGSQIKIAINQDREIIPQKNIQVPQLAPWQEFPFHIVINQSGPIGIVIEFVNPHIQNTRKKEINGIIV